MQLKATDADGERIKRATEAMIDALEKTGASDNAIICLAAVAGLMGCLCAATARPEQSLASVNQIARGILDGTLLEP